MNMCNEVILSRKGGKMKGFILLAACLFILGCKVEVSSDVIGQAPEAVEEESFTGTPQVAEDEGEEPFAAAPRELDYVAVWEKISAGSSHTCALNLVGEVFCWGVGDLGRLGNGKWSGTSYPTSVLTLDEDGNAEPLRDVVQVSAASEHTCALTSVGEVWCWGAGSRGKLGSGDEDSSRYAKLVVESSRSETPLGGVIQVSVGLSNTCALTSSGQVKCWGRADSGRLGNDMWTGNTSYPVFVVSGDGLETPLSGIIQISGGGGHTCALHKSRRVLCWGSGATGQLGTGSHENSNYPVFVVEGEVSENPLSDVVQVSAGEEHTCALISGGEVKCWGLAESGRLGNNEWSGDVNYPVSVVEEEDSKDPLTNIVQISAGGEYTCALTSIGEVKCWGRAESGRLGNDTWTGYTPYPDSVVLGEGLTTPLSGIIQINAGQSHTCALTSEGQSKCWGKGGDHQLGSRENVAVNVPVWVVKGDDLESEPLDLGNQLERYRCTDQGESVSCEDDER